MLISAAAHQLDTAASVYDAAARTLSTVGQESRDLSSHLVQARSVEWSSPAAEAFGDAVHSALALPAALVEQEAQSLAVEAGLIADSLRGLADGARALAASVSIVLSLDWGAMAASRYEELRGEAVRALAPAALEASRSAAGFVSFIHEHQGIPPVLTGLSRMLG
ncbi:hypothetical protein [Nesterenkonia flava]|uniref:PPE family domain-containing protein n=1 Tax=Nesterenkonia flava TaxID=469799 RepID=A0ABU1FWM8_9MICC|nr:hypothetical protein [Nesterenkonia flava]MDR5712727.1 hypothetical protein [Nesterenkonia flava]